MRHLKAEGFSVLTLALVLATSLVAVPTKGDAAPPTKEEIEQEKKEIRQIPKLPGGNIIIDGNKLLQQLGIVQYELNRRESAEEDEERQP